MSVEVSPTFKSAWNVFWKEKACGMGLISGFGLLNQGCSQGGVSESAVILVY